MAKPDDDNTHSHQPSLSQLVDLFVYAPIGMLFDYPDVIPQLVKKGKSQVKLAKVMGEVALRRGQANPEAFATQAFASAGGVIAKLITDVADSVGLTDSDGPQSAKAALSESTPVDVAPVAKEIAGKLPIAGYDDLTARKIISMVGDLTPAQRARVRAYESSHRARKTVLSKLDQLGD